MTSGPDWRQIEGWLTEAEGMLLMECARTAPVGEVVEVGSYHGRSTVALASVRPVWAVDPHEGDMGEPTMREPSWEPFLKNIGGLPVTPVRRRSYEVTWSLPIGMLFIDGMHNYEFVSQDYRHFRPYLVPRALVAFHDYGDSATPDIARFVDSLGHKVFARADSLAVIRV